MPRNPALKEGDICPQCNKPAPKTKMTVSVCKDCYNENRRRVKKEKHGALPAGPDAQQNPFDARKRAVYNNPFTPFGALGEDDPLRRPM